MTARQPATLSRERLRLARAEGVGPVLYRRLLARYGSPSAALEALPALARAGGRATAPRVPSAAEAERELAAFERAKARLLFVDQPDYPPLLAHLTDAPALIAVQGDVALLSIRAVAVVGARNASANGQRMAERLAADLAEAGICVVSGLARGIDAAAHRGALAAGRTVAVVAGGLDAPYPPEHAELQARIGQAGAVVAESPLGVQPQARHFPRRNRIITGLSLGVIVVEAAPRSGSLITARLAAEAGRELFAVPGSPLDPRARGANDLIRQGAHLTEGVEDVLANLPDSPAREGLARDPLFARGRPGTLAEPASVLWPERAEEQATPADEARARGQVIELVGTDPVAVDDLIRRCQLPAAAVMGVLIELELAGRLQTLPGNRVALLAEPG